MQSIIAKCGNRCDLCPLYRDNFIAEEAAAIDDALYTYHLIREVLANLRREQTS
jgi:hypothetical protein